MFRFAGEVRAQEEQARQAAVLRFAGLYAASPLGIALADRAGEIVEANPALGKMLGRTPESLRGTMIADLATDTGAAAMLADGLSELATQDMSLYRQLIELTNADDEPLWVNVTLAHLPGDAPGSAYPVMMVEDVNDLHLLQEKLRYQTLHDSLTGLPNSTSFAAQLETAIGSGRPGQLALVYLDVDGFKVVNDGLGAGVGDQVLRGVARKLAAVFGEHEAVLARLSGDGFAVLLQGELNATEVIALVQRALEELGEPTYLEGIGIGVSASAGIVVRAAAGADPSELQRAAEIALHRAKEAGKAQWMLFDPELDAKDRSRYRLGAAIAGALENGEFSLIYQPTVKLADPAQLAAVNAGVRWHHTEFGLLESDEFFPLAEETGMMIPLGRWLLKEALAATARWQERFGAAAPDVCLRLPYRLATDPDLVLMVKEELDRNNLPARALRLCTDGPSVLDPNGEVIDSLAVLADLGAHLVLAVSGTADLELIRKHQLPVRHIILSGDVVDAVAETADEAATRHLSHLVTRGREMNLRIGAEGVRSLEQAGRLREVGVIAARGPFVTESATADDVEEMIARHAAG
ncbi:putative bifunctional diguanylate cyclase/phosphodiesterase [Amycolatopsis suaedae]|uniref:putative bifunctional diguanylate cyclase/phosphodiesterase n=1 Tax=Amycolatopsis suaedae TaxID=2510978 RepID=UPI003B82EC2F